MFFRKKQGPKAVVVQDIPSQPGQPYGGQLTPQYPGPSSQPDSAFMNSPAGDRLDERGRFQTASGVGGYGMTRPVGDRHYDVQSFTGYAMGTVPGTQWNRGFIYRAFTPTLRIPNEVGMVDPTDPSSWNDGSGF